MIVESYEDIIVLSGALRLNFWETIHTAISLTLKRHPTGVVVDCSGITECTPEGAETFRDAQEYIEEHDARIIVASVPAQVMEAIRSTPGVRSQLPIAATVEDARRSLDLLANPEHNDRKRKPDAMLESKIVLLLNGDSSDDSGALAASRVAQIMHASVIMAFIILIPRELPLQAPLPEREALAKATFDKAAAVFAAERVSCMPRLERGREVGVTLDEISREMHAHTVIVSLTTNTNEIERELKVLRSILLKVGQSVMIVRPPVDR